MNATESTHGENFDFKTYFKDNYEKQISRYLNLLTASKWLLYVSLIFFMLLYIFAIAKVDDLVVVNAIFFPLIVFVMSSAVLRFVTRFIDVNGRDIIAYHLFESANYLDRHDAENADSRKNAFINKSLKHLREFNKTLKQMLSRTKSEMPLALPDFERLSKLRANVMNSLYPNVQTQHKGSEVLFALSSIFSLDKQYEKLPDINKMFEVLAPTPFKEKEWLLDSLFEPIRKSFFTTAIILLVLMSVGVFSAVIFIHASLTGWNFDLKYTSDNVAIIIVGILAAWAAIVVVIKPKSEK